VAYFNVNLDAWSILPHWQAFWSMCDCYSKWGSLLIHFVCSCILLESLYYIMNLIFLTWLVLS